MKKLCLPKSKNCIVIKSISELIEAKKCVLCMHIILERRNVITIWDRVLLGWDKKTYSFFGDYKEQDEETTGFMSYQLFYNYCGIEEIEKMKQLIKPIPLWESYEQMHYANIDYVGNNIYKDIFIYDVNSSFTFGALQLPFGFEKLKEYMLTLFEKKKNAKDTKTRSKYKNLQNYLIGYFARIKEFVSVRSEIINNSNNNIIQKMKEIINNDGVVYLSNTDSIVTDYKGSLIMNKYIGNNVGQFKLEQVSSKLKYYSPNCYQLDNKLVYSGVGYFAKKHTDLFNEEYAEQKGRLVEPYDFFIEEDEFFCKVCRVRYGSIIVSVYDKSGSLINNYEYRIG